MNDPAIQTRQTITQYTQTNVEMEANQQATNAHFTEFEKCRRGGETEIAATKGHHQVFSEKVVNSQVESHVYLE